jgi:magnesium chelatase family protein
MIGGGRHPQPGEVSLANNGVLFLDELPEFRKSALQVLRQPMEDGKVIISRASFSISFPADFMLVAAMNPCPCGFATDPNNECHCQPWLIQKYLSKLSGPLLDRIDIHVEVPPVHYRELMQVPQGESSYKIRGRVSEVQEIQKKRYDGKQGNFWNSRMSSSEVRKYCKLDRESHELLQTAIQKLGFSARAYERILKVARTVADLDGSEGLKAAHLAEAIQYRSLDRTRL